MMIPDYIALSVLIVLIVWAVADRSPRGISEALRTRVIVRTSLRSDLIRAAQFAIGEGLRTEFSPPVRQPDDGSGWHPTHRWGEEARPPTAAETCRRLCLCDIRCNAAPRPV